MKLKIDTSLLSKIKIKVVEAIQITYYMSLGIRTSTYFLEVNRYSRNLSLGIAEVE